MRILSWAAPLVAALVCVVMWAIRNTVGLSPCLFGHRWVEWVPGTNYRRCGRCLRREDPKAPTELMVAHFTDGMGDVSGITAEPIDPSVLTGGPGLTFRPRTPDDQEPN